MHTALNTYAARCFVFNYCDGALMVGPQMVSIAQNALIEKAAVSRASSN
jgi:hypothetical protein